MANLKRQLTENDKTLERIESHLRILKTTNKALQKPITSLENNVAEISNTPGVNVLKLRGFLIHLKNRGMLIN